MNMTTAPEIPIAFGTDGWRGRVGFEFTQDNFERVVQAYADYLNFVGLSGGEVIVGYDNRILSAACASIAGEVLAGNGHVPIVFDESVPTPLVSWAAASRGASGGCVVTASHNSSDYNGFKIKDRKGRSAGEDVTSMVEVFVDRHPAAFCDYDRRASRMSVATEEIRTTYRRQIAALVDLERIRGTNAAVVLDPMHGTGGRWTQDLIAGSRLRTELIRETPDPSFGGVNPEPIGPNLGALAEAVRESGALIGIATDGDADRIGAIDEKGDVLSMHQIFPILLSDLARRQGERGAVVTTFSQSVLIKRMAEAFGLPLFETPIGFKYIAALMLREDVLIGAEESGGIGFRGHIPERDGILSGLKLLEAIFAAGETPNAIYRRLANEFGRFYYERRDLKSDKHRGTEFVAALAVDPPDRIGGMPVDRVETIDGTKLVLADDSWVLFRQSGTEPVLRVYVEATSENLNRCLLTDAAALASEASGIVNHGGGAGVRRLNL